MSATALALVLPQEVELTLRRAQEVDLTLKLEQIDAQLQEVQTLQAARHVYVRAKALKMLAAEHKLGREIKKKARAIAYDAWRRYGELYHETEKNTGTKGQLAGRDASGGTKLELPEDPIPTLAELGIDRKWAAASVTLARLPIEFFAQIRNGETTLEKLRA